MWMYVIYLLFVSFCDCAQVDDYMDRCISSKYHKNKPGPEGQALASLHCDPWKKHSCCTYNTTSLIDKDGTISLYGMIYDQCPQKKNMSKGCRKYFDRDTCFYECSTNVGPWIVVDSISKKTRKERMMNVPLCASDCRDWYHACENDFTCNDNWGKNWIWKYKGTTKMCPKECKLFKEYFPDPKTFCEKIFNHSFKFEDDESKCLNMKPYGTKNYDVAFQRAKEIVDGINVSQNLKSFKVLIVLTVASILLLV